MAKSITVYCASSRKIDKKYFDATRELARVLLSKDARVIYGGGAVGLMGALADTYIENNGQIMGVIPEFMVKVEWAHPKVDDMVIVRDMHERKKKLIENTDAVIALPGGTGTLEELTEVISLKRLGKFNKPIFLLNTDNFFTPLHNFFCKMAAEHFLLKEQLNMWKLINKPEEFWNAFNNFPDWANNTLSDAQV